MRVVVYDRSWNRQVPGLGTSWWLGSQAFVALGRFDAARGVRSWAEALEWLGSFESLREVQYWGHGKWGSVAIGRERMDLDSLRSGTSTGQALRQLRLEPDARVWLRTCETFGAEPGHRFAVALAETLGCIVAGHTYVIGPLQSGLHVLAPGARPGWSPEEGLALGTPEAPRKARLSHPFAPNTIHCLQSRIPRRLVSVPGSA